MEPHPDRGNAPDRIPALDGLRGCAVLLVIFVHTNLGFAGVRSLDGVYNAIASAGWVGVDLFFVLSGFLITGILYDARRADRYFRNFYARRTLRIWPLYYGFLIFALWMLPTLLPGWGLGSGWAKLSLLTFWYNFWAPAHSPLPLYHIFWSLCVEEHYYLLWPLVIRFTGRRAAMKWCLVLMGVSLLFRVGVLASGTWIQYAYLITPCRLDGLAAGSLVALSIRDPADSARLSRWARPALIAAGALLVGLGLTHGHLAPHIDLKREPIAAVDSKLIVTLGMTGVSMFFAALLVVLLGSPQGPPGRALRRVMEAPALRSVGKYSYGMYVFHALVLEVIRWGVLRASPAEAYPWPVKLALTACVAGVAYGVAFVSYHLYEKRFLRLKRFFRHEPPQAACDGGGPGPQQGDDPGKLRVLVASGA